MNIPIKHFLVFVIRRQLLLEYLALMRDLIFENAFTKFAYFDALVVANF